ncbi:MAG: hypothetical protein WBG70_15400 [Spirulinaceae cyanobacterium]
MVLLEYPVIFTEYTFLQEDDEAYADERLHTYWGQLKLYSNSLTCEVLNSWL